MAHGVQEVRMGPGRNLGRKDTRGMDDKCTVYSYDETSIQSPPERHLRRDHSGAFVRTCTKQLNIVPRGLCSRASAHLERPRFPLLPAHPVYPLRTPQPPSHPYSTRKPCRHAPFEQYYSKTHSTSPAGRRQTSMPTRSRRLRLRCKYISTARKAAFGRNAESGRIVKQEV